MLTSNRFNPIENLSDVLEKGCVQLSKSPLINTKSWTANNKTYGWKIDMPLGIHAIIKAIRGKTKG